MKRFILIALIALVQFNICQSAVFESVKDKFFDDYGDDASYFSPDEEDDAEDDSPKPIYDLKDAPKLFEKFIKDYERKYKNKKDHDEHYNNFVENLKEINRINSDKEVSATVDINLFADYSASEKQSLLGIPQ